MLLGFSSTPAPFCVFLSSCNDLITISNLDACALPFTEYYCPISDDIRIYQQAQFAQFEVQQFGVQQYAMVPDGLQNYLMSGKVDLVHNPLYA